PGPVQHRHPDTPDLGTGPGRIRDGLADPRWAPDREPDRSADNDRSGTAGRDAAALGPYSPRLLYRPSLIFLALLPNGDRQHAARDERRVRPRLWHPRAYPRPGLSPLQRGVSIRQARLRPCRETRLHCLPYQKHTINRTSASTAELGIAA